MKKLLFILFFFFVKFCAFAQSDTGKTTTGDTGIRKPMPVKAKKIKKRVIPDTIATADTLKRRLRTDTLKRGDSLAKANTALPQIRDTALPLIRDTALPLIRDTALPQIRDPDKITVTDTAKDSAKNFAAATVTKKPIDSIYLKLLDNPFFGTKARPIYLVINERRVHAKDEIFYLLSGLLLFLAFIKLVFSRYFKNIFKLFFQPSFRQKQTREQLQQSNLPSLLLNLFFILSAGTYISFLLQYYELLNPGFWLLLLYTTASLLVLYLFKFILLSFAGWVFDVKAATESYVFAVFLINKILGVILIPFTAVIAFSEPPVINISITISILIILLLFIYRYLVSYPSVRREVKVSVLHFFFYICAFEIMPLLLIYKTLIIFFNKSH